MIYICIGNVYNAFPTLAMIQTYLTQQNDNGLTDHSEFTRIYAQIPFYMFSSMLFINARSHNHIEAVACRFTIMING
jgi:hypothetical protein